VKVPTKIDGARVLEWAWSEVPFGTIALTDGTGAVPIHGLALCQYEGSDAVYRFSCNADWEAEQDAACASIAEAKAQLPNQYGGVAVTWKKA